MQPLFRVRAAATALFALCVTASPGCATSWRERGTEPAPVRQRQAPTYLAEVVSCSGGWLHRWHEEDFPLRLYVDTGSLSSKRATALREQVLDAAAEWRAASDGKVAFAEVGRSEDADVVVSWRPRIDGGDLAETTYRAGSRGWIERADVHLAERARDTGRVGGKLFDATILHELGHALGLHHSSEPDDALYAHSRHRTLSERDLDTLYALYAEDPGPRKSAPRLPCR